MLHGSFPFSSVPVLVLFAQIDKDIECDYGAGITPTTRRSLLLVL